MVAIFASENFETEIWRYKHLIRVLAITHTHQILNDLGLDILKRNDIKWYWVDFNMPTEEEAQLLDSYFQFHPLAIEDCLHHLQRAKLEYYDDYSFLVVHAINHSTLEASEVDLFIGKNFVVSFHFHELNEIESAWEYFRHLKDIKKKGPLDAAHKIMDKLVDMYFPVVYRIEEQIQGLERHGRRGAMSSLINETFIIRGDLLHLHHTITPMRELLYRILESDRIPIEQNRRAYFRDIHDHLIKLGQLIETNRAITSEIRDNYLSLNSYYMNSIMKTLTVITTIFMPLTFIAGIYGMNFENIPELTWKYGYFVVLGIMGIMGIGMVLWFKKKGWFRN